MKKLTGVVVRTKMQKTAVVRVDRQWAHPLYQKTVKRSKKYLVDNPGGAAEGDKVTMVECRPISKRKRWRIVKRSDGVTE